MKEVLDIRGWDLFHPIRLMEGLDFRRREFFHPLRLKQLPPPNIQPFLQRGDEGRAGYSGAGVVSSDSAEGRAGYSGAGVVSSDSAETTPAPEYPALPSAR